jgi:phosphoribosylanthranilate isomerase
MEAPMSTRVKICGLRTPETLAAALEAGAEMIGVVFHPGSPRFLAVSDAARLLAPARGRAEIIALVQDADDASIAAIVAQVAPDLLQLHGRETLDRVAAIRAKTKTPVIKAIGIATSADVAAALAYADVADRLLFDAKPPPEAAHAGGHGAAFDWRLLDGVRDTVPFMLSGGLTPDTVGAAIRAVRPAAVDVSSGVEVSKGVKSETRIRAFIAAVRAADQALTAS